MSDYSKQIYDILKNFMSNVQYDNHGYRFVDGSVMTEAKTKLRHLLQEVEIAAKLNEAKLARKQFTIAVYDSDFIIANGDRITELQSQQDHPNA